MCDNPGFIEEADDAESPPPTYTSRREGIVPTITFDDNVASDENEATSTNAMQAADKWVVLKNFFCLDKTFPPALHYYVNGVFRLLVDLK